MYGTVSRCDVPPRSQKQNFPVPYTSLYMVWIHQIYSSEFILSWSWTLTFDLVNDDMCLMDTLSLSPQEWALFLQSGQILRFTEIVNPAKLKKWSKTFSIRDSATTKPTPRRESVDHVIKRRRSLRHRLRVVHILGSQSKKGMCGTTIWTRFPSIVVTLFAFFFYQNNSQKYPSGVIYLAAVI